MHVKRFAKESMMTEEEKQVKKKVLSPTKLAVTVKEQIAAAKGHPFLRTEPVNRKERRQRKFKLDKAHGRGFTKSSSEGRMKRHAN